MPYSAPPHVVFGFVINEVALLERAKAAGDPTDLPQDRIEYCESRHLNESQVDEMHWFHRTQVMKSYVRREIIPKVDIPELELRTIWVGDGDQMWCLSMPCIYASKRARTPEMLKQVVLLAQLLGSPFPPALWCSGEASVPKSLKKRRIPNRFLSWRIESLGHD